MAMVSFRLDEGTQRKLDELTVNAESRTDAIVAAIDLAWRMQLAVQLQDGYQQAHANNPYYPYESVQEMATSRTRRRGRRARMNADR